MTEEKGFSLRRFFLGSISRKLYTGFLLIIIIMASRIMITYDLSNEINEKTLEIMNVEAPLEIVSEQVRSYDAILTGNAHVALLHSLQNESGEVKEHKDQYDQYGAKLDDLLKKEAPALLTQSKRTPEQKEKIYAYLKQLDRINIQLVDLETRAFQYIDEGKPEEAYSLIVGENYHKYKNELAGLSQGWADEEHNITLQIRQEILNVTQKIFFVNIILGGVSILVSVLIAYFIADSITKPVSELYSATKRLEKGDYHSRVDIKSGDELEELGDAFNATSGVLENLDEERKQIDKVKTQFLSITGHELRSPMTPMRAQLQMLLGDYFGKMNAEQKESIEIVLRNTERLDRIIVDFLEISRIEAARLKFNYANISLEEPIKKLITEMKGVMPEKKVRIILNIEKLPTMKVDPDRTMQVLRNVVNNAVKFSNQGGKVEIFAKRTDGHMLFSVKDYGVGIPKDQQNRIFEPFFQVGGMYQRTSGGTGLGLAICRGIIESQGGRIWFESQEGKGTQFYFTVPLVPPSETKPIKVLFSRKEFEEKELLKIFTEYLGPMGAGEFERLKTKGNGLTEERINEYVSELEKIGVMPRQTAQLLRNRVAKIIGTGQTEMEKV